MKTCTQTSDISRVVRAGQWPNGCSRELREHVASCARCSEEVQILSVFAHARDTAMRGSPVQSSGLLWWKAQLRRRRESMERLERPAFGIPAVTIAASVMVLLAVFAAAWKRMEWSRLMTAFRPSGWNGWLLGSLGTLLCGFAVVALLVGLGVTEKRR